MTEIQYPPTKTPVFVKINDLIIRDDYRRLVQPQERRWEEQESIRVIRVDDKPIVVEGFGKIDAFERHGRSIILATVTSGTATDAIAAVLLSFGSGKRQSRDDMQYATAVALAHPPWTHLSARHLEQVSGLSSYLVRQHRKRLPIGEQPNSTIGIDGRKVYNSLADVADLKLNIRKALETTPNETNTKIAQDLGCYDMTVAGIRRELTEQQPDKFPPKPPRRNAASRIAGNTVRSS